MKLLQEIFPMKPIIIANWKMNLNLEDAFDQAIKLNMGNYGANFLLAPPIPYLAYFAKNFKNIKICAQNVSSINGFGPYTGEYSAEILKNCGVDYAIIGHSERRNIFMESNKLIKQKAANCLNSGIIPIICVGETLETRQNNHYTEFITTQLAESIPKNIDYIIIAYEPFWAIGTGLVPTRGEILEIFELIKANIGITILAKKVQLVYGGSVSSKNYKEIISIDGNDGVILGSASLNADELNLILN